MQKLHVLIQFGILDRHSLILYSFCILELRISQFWHQCVQYGIDTKMKNGENSGGINKLYAKRCAIPDAPANRSVHQHAKTCTVDAAYWPQAN